MHIYSFNLPIAVSTNKELVVSPKDCGGKGYHLIKMAANNFPVPPGFVISPHHCLPFLNAEVTDDQLYEVLDKYYDALAQHSPLGSLNPLVSVRSGAPVSMPGMCDTVLNVGVTKHHLKRLSEDVSPTFSLDLFRRFIQMYGEVVGGIPSEEFSQYLNKVKKCKYGQPSIPKDESDFSEKHLLKLVNYYLGVLDTHDVVISDDPKKQMLACIKAVFKSWDSDRAKAYRKINNISDDMGTGGSHSTYGVR